MIGQTISHYKILEKLGEGGMGVVYKAHDNKLERDVAIKFLPAALTSDPDAKKRFIREAKAASSLDHPNICNIHEVGESEDGRSFIVMAYYEGHSLKEVIASRQLKIPEALGVALQVATGLKKAHDSGIVHRDIKPGNIIISSDGIAKIVDFGLVKVRGTAKLTREGLTLGTVEYMSPEQVKGEEVDHRTDIWSLGCVMFEMLTGSAPFEGDYDQAVVYSILNTQLDSVSALRADIPSELASIVHKCLEKEKERRYQTIEKLIGDLLRIQALPNYQVHELDRISGRTGKRRKWIYLAAGLTLILAAAMAIVFKQTSHVRANDRKSVAVLPFVNLGADQENDYFSDGITDDVLTQLYKIGGLKVTSRTTMQRYKGISKSIREIGRELNADAVLEGSVRREGNRIRIVAQLIDARSDDHIWAENYDRDMKDVFTVQTEIAQNIAAALRAKLSAAEQSRLSLPGGSNIEAYDLILQGGYRLSRGGRQDIYQAIEKYENAISLEPDNARAWAQMAICYARLADLGALPTDEGYSKARQAAERALRLDDQLAQAHSIMGWIKRSYDWDWSGAAAECRKALELAPGDVTVIRNMANLEKSLGNFDEAIRLIKNASDLDPQRVPIYTSLGLFSMYANRLNEAQYAYQRALELNPHNPATHTFLGMVYILQGKPDSALWAAKLEGDEGWRLYGMAQAYYSASMYSESDTALSTLITKYGSESAYQVAQVYGFQGKVDSAFNWLDRAYILRDGGLSEIKGDPFMKKVENDPRYAAFISRMNLPY